MRYVAFLRGINLGNRRIKMDELRKVVEALGYDNVATYIASGNVIFDVHSKDPDALEPELENHLREELGYEVDTFVRSLEDLEAIDATSIFPSAGEDPENRIHVMFLKEEADEGIEDNLQKLETEDDSFRVAGREAYWLRRGRMSDSAVSINDLSKALDGKTNTMRNMNTVRRIVAKFSG